MISFHSSTPEPLTPMYIQLRLSRTTTSPSTSRQVSDSSASFRGDSGPGRPLRSPEFIATADRGSLTFGVVHDTPEKLSPAGMFYQSVQDFADFDRLCLGRLMRTAPVGATPVASPFSSATRSVALIYRPERGARREQQLPFRCSAWKLPLGLRVRDPQLPGDGGSRG